MHKAHERVREVTEAIIAMLSGPHKQPGEAIVRQVIVLRLLHAAGWDIWNPDEVVPEETNQVGQRPDFILRAGAEQLALEIKGANIALSNRELTQAVLYAATVGTRWAWLTNGRVWVLLDEHRPGTPEQREVLRLDMTLNAPDPFATDFAELLGAQVWRAGKFALALEQIQVQQERRLARERVLREKRPEVEAFQSKWDIGSFHKAAELYAEQGKITEAERNVLLEQSEHKRPIQSSMETMKASLIKELPVVIDQQIEFSIRFQQAIAVAIYRAQDGGWTVLRGSTALPRLVNNDAGVILRSKRENWLAEGVLEIQGDLLFFKENLKFRSPSAAAMAISGYPESGWDKWKDAQGRPAQHYRPKKL